MAIVDAVACTPNIGPRERQKRMRFGIVCFVVGAAVAALLIAFDVARWWRLALFVPFALGAVGVFQAREKT